MKYFVLLSLFLVSVQAVDPKVVEEFMTKVAKFGEKCIEETQASSEDVAQLMAHQIPTTHEGKCMISCVYKAFKIQKDDGMMDRDELGKQMEIIKDSDPELFEKIMAVAKKCQGIVEVDADHCITAANAATCAVAEGKAAGLKSEMFGV